jgi:hypothetical protein
LLFPKKNEVWRKGKIFENCGDLRDRIGYMCKVDALTRSNLGISWNIAGRSLRKPCEKISLSLKKKALS